jgi:hypothetical protein
MRSPLLPALFGFAVTGAVMLVSAPVSAQAATDYRCTALAEQARTAAANTSDATKAQRAQRFIATGAALCEARSEGSAARQYRSALRVLGVDEIRNAAPSEIATQATAVPAGGN